jgi:predicted TIM-barrel fold metal-dependent hydrolase
LQCGDPLGFDLRGGIPMSDARVRVREIRRRLGYPVIDSDGHLVEFVPAVRDHVEALAGRETASHFDQYLKTNELAQRLTPAERRARGMFRMTWWGFPAANSRDRATALLPKLLHERLPELGIDFSVLYPTFGLGAIGLPDAELRRVVTRAYNQFFAESFAPYRDRLCPVALIPMHTPAEAIAELDHCVKVLGLRAACLAGFVRRPLEIAGAAPIASWVDTFGPESPHDYSPVWQRCVELGIAPTFHQSAMGLHARGSLTSYVYNHVGNFAAGGELACRSLLLAGVPLRFPSLRFAFLEGGAGWAASLYADLIGHFAKRGRHHIHHYDPSRIDRALLADLFRKYGDDRFRRHEAELDAGVFTLGERAIGESEIDEFAASGFASRECIRDAFARCYFGCEADDPLNAVAFDREIHPLGARMNALFGSDLGHWDVPEMDEVLPEAWEAVEDGHLSESDFRDFVFANPVALWTAGNRDFFAGTSVEQAIAQAL